MPKSPTTATPADHKSKTYGITKSKLTDLDLPSGGFVEVRRPGLQGLIKAGILESFDTLTAIVGTETIPKAEGGAPAGAPKPPSAEQIVEALAVMDSITVYVVTQPTILPAPENDDDRDPDATYVDDMDVQDKSFIVSFAMGGTASLERFRAESEGAVGSVPAGT